MDNESVEVMKRVESLLERLVKLQAASILLNELKDDFSKKLYELTGKKKRGEILKALKCSPNRVSEIWNRWEDLGLLVKDGHGYRKVI